MLNRKTRSQHVMLAYFVAHSDDYVKHPGFGLSTGSNNAYAVSLSPAPSSYVQGLGVAVTIHADSTAAATLNGNGLGAKKILKTNGNAVSNLKANGIYTVRYNPATDSGMGAFILQGEGVSGKMPLHLTFSLVKQLVQM